MPQLRVLIAVQDAVESKNLYGKLLKAGHLVVGQAREAGEVLRRTFEIQPDLVLMDPGLPDYGGLGVAQVIDEHRVAPVVFVARNYIDITRQAGNGWLFSYLLSPYSDDDLYLAVEVARSNFQRLLVLERENARLKKTLTARKLVERAKGLLMDKQGWSEQEAYKYLQRISMNTSRSLTVVAREVINKFDEKILTNSG
jgi:response regulator NasT